MSLCYEVAVFSFRMKIRSSSFETLSITIEALNEKKRGKSGLGFSLDLSRGTWRAPFPDCLTPFCGVSE